MDIKREIDNFRSQALMSRYESAIKSGHKILQELAHLGKVLDRDFSNVQKDIREELDYCIQLKTFMQGDKPKQNLQHIPKKQEETIFLNYSETFQNKKWKSQSVNQLKNHSQVQNSKEEIESSGSQTVEQKLHKNMILPLNMPVFKLKSSIFLIKTKNCLKQVLQYLVHYDFKEFPSIDLSDLGVQNIVNCKKQMQETEQKRAVIVLQAENNRADGFSNKEIDKLKNIVQVYRETFEKGLILKKYVLALIVQERPISIGSNSSLLKSSDQKNVNFE